MLDIIIRGGRVIDGSGTPTFRGDIGVRNDRIVELSPNVSDSADLTIDASGLIVTPGFIDAHSHSDLTALLHPSAERSLRQGITTEIVGNCGLSPAPLSDKNRSYWRRYMAYWAQTDASRVQINWNSISELLDRFSDLTIGANLGFLVGHNTLRSCVMGLEGEGGERKEASEEEISRSKEILESSLRAGAFGLSTGLTYPPGRNASTRELIELARVVAEYDGAYSSHLRGGSDPLQGLKEFLLIVRSTGVRGVVSHLRGRVVADSNALVGVEAHAYLKILENARGKGSEIYFDVIPIPSGSNSLVSILFGGWGIVSFEEIFDENDFLIPTADFISRISNERTRNIVVSRIRSQEKSLGIRPKLDTRLIHYSRNHPELVHKTLKRVSKMLKMNMVDTILHLVKEDQGDTRWGNMSYEEDLEQLLQHPSSMPSSDGYWTPESMQTATMSGIPGPRIFGSFAYFLERYCQEKRALPIEATIAKMTSLPAKAFRINDRGLVQKGMYADLVAFNLDQVHNHATYSRPCAFPTGIRYVLLNGKVAISQGTLSTARYGRVLRHSSIPIPQV